jgi:hypothetical protein
MPQATFRNTILAACVGALALVSSVDVHRGVSLSGSVAAAEGCGSEDVQAGEKKQGKSHVEIIGGKRVIVIDSNIIVCGKVPRPSVVYVLTAKNIDYEWETLKQDFMPSILNSVKKAPF